MARFEDAPASPDTDAAQNLETADPRAIQRPAKMVAQPLELLPAEPLLLEKDLVDSLIEPHRLATIRLLKTATEIRLIEPSPGHRQAREFDVGRPHGYE